MIIVKMNDKNKLNIILFTLNKSNGIEREEIRHKSCSNTTNLCFLQNESMCKCHYYTLQDWKWVNNELQYVSNRIYLTKSSSGLMGLLVFHS